MHDAQYLKICSIFKEQKCARKILPYHTVQCISYLAMYRLFNVKQLKVLVLNAQCLCLVICRVKMFLHLLVLVGQELLALSNLPHLFYQLDKGAAVLEPMKEAGVFG